jgi:hypothetical protein
VDLARLADASFASFFLPSPAERISRAQEAKRSPLIRILLSRAGLVRDLICSLLLLVGLARRRHGIHPRTAAPLRYAFKQGWPELTNMQLTADGTTRTMDAWHEGVEYLLVGWRRPCGVRGRPQRPLRVSSPEFFSSSTAALPCLRLSPKSKSHAQPARGC